MTTKPPPPLPASISGARIWQVSSCRLGIAATAGWVYGFFHLTLNPYVLSLDITFLWLFIVLVGGLGSMRGVACATILLGIGPELLGFASSQQVLISGALVLIVALLAPRGIGGLLDDLEMRIRGRTHG